MRQVTSLHRTLVVLAVGLLALAAPLVAYADGGPDGSLMRMNAESRREARSAGLSSCRRPRRRAGLAPAQRPTSVPFRSKSSIACAIAALGLVADGPPARRTSASADRARRSGSARRCHLRAARPRRRARERSHDAPRRARSFASTGIQGAASARVVARCVRPRKRRPLLGLVDAPWR